MSKIFKNIIDLIYPYRIFLKHLSYSILTLFLLFFLWYKYLDFYTNKGDVVKVPNFENKYYNDLNQIVGDIDVQFEITDTGYNRAKQRGVILSQYPFPNSEVKPGRKIKLKINSLYNRTVNFPNIIDLPYSQAINELKNKGFNIGDLNFQPNMAEGRVLAAVIKGTNNKVTFDQKLYEGTIIDLTIGSGLGTKSVNMPNLIGLFRNEAELQVKTNRLNIGLVQLFDGENFSVINDTLMFASDSIIIYDQDPKFGKKVKIGDYVDLYFTFYSLENDTTFNSYLDKND